MLGVDSYEKCVDLFHAARHELSEILSAYEFFDKASVLSVKEVLDCSIPEFLEGQEFGIED